MDAILINTECKKDTSNGLIYEIWTFSNKVVKAHYSSFMHEMNFISNLYDLNIENYKDFVKCESIYLKRIKK